MKLISWCAAVALLLASCSKDQEAKDTPRGQASGGPGAGGRPTHHFNVTKRGLETLRTAQQHLSRMRAGLESILKVAR